MGQTNRNSKTRCASRVESKKAKYPQPPLRKVHYETPVPTVLDRLIQQAVMQVLQKRWDRTFSAHSYGLRPRRSAHQAVAQAQQYLAAGHRWVVDLDLEKFLDPASYCPLIHESCSNSAGWWSTTLIRKPLRR